MSPHALYGAVLVTWTCIRELGLLVAQGQNGVGGHVWGVLVRYVMHSEMVRGIVTALDYTRVNCKGFIVTHWMTSYGAL